MLLICASKESGWGVSRDSLRPVSELLFIKSDMALLGVGQTDR